MKKVKDWINTGNSLSEQQAAVQWSLGDWWNSSRLTHGERKKIVESDEFTGLKYESLRKFGKVCKMFKIGTRVPSLTFRHHQECSSLSLDEALLVLEWAAENNASTREIAMRVKEMKLVTVEHQQSKPLSDNPVKAIFQRIERGESVVVSTEMFNSTEFKKIRRYHKVRREINLHHTGLHNLRNPFLEWRNSEKKNYECYINYWIPNNPTILGEIDSLVNVILIEDFKNEKYSVGNFIISRLNN